MIHFNSKPRVEEITDKENIQIVSYPIVSLDLLSVHGLVITQDEKLFAFFSKNKYEKMIVKYKEEYYGITERVGETHYLKHLNI